MKVYDVPTLVQRIVEKPYMLEMGKGKISKWFNLTKGEVDRAKQIARNKIKYGTEYHPRDVRFSKPNMPKILVFDLETSPLRAYVWKRWKQNINLSQTISEWFMLSWSAKWLLSTETMSDVLTPDEVIEEDDERITKSLWKLIDQADVIVAHNALGFDVGKMNSRFIINGLNPPSSYKVIDTKLIATKEFGFSSDKLDALAGYFGFKTKLDTTFELWANCMKGDPDSLSYMEEYNRYDVELLEEVYLKLRPWMKSHPNVGMYLEEDKTVCSVCGSNSVNLLVDKYYYTQTGKYPIHRCDDCGGLTRGRRTVLDKTVSKTLGTSIPR